MKTELTLEQSEKLIEFGLDAKLASCRQYANAGKIQNGIEQPPELKPVFCLTDILAILPKQIKDYHLNIDIIKEGYNIGYIQWDDAAPYEAVVTRSINAYFAPELIDALYQLLIWTIDNVYINLKTNKQ